MNVFKEFEKALENFEFESSDTKLEVWKQIKYNQNFVDLVKLAMQFAYEQGQNDAQDY